METKKWTQLWLDYHTVNRLHRNRKYQEIQKNCYRIVVCEASHNSVNIVSKFKRVYPLYPVAVGQLIFSAAS